MFFAFWQLKTIAFGLLLASCLGYELLRTCQRDYCYERSVESRNIETGNLRKWYGDESHRAGTARKSENIDNISTGLRENRLDQFNTESNREIRRELTTLAENRRQLVRHEPSRREDHQLIMRVEETPKIQRSVKLVLERRQEANTERFSTPIRRLNKRESRQEGNELRDVNQEPRRFNDRRSERQPEILQRTEESQAERKIHDIDRQSRRSSDRIFESERNLLQRREIIPEERESRRSDEQTTSRNPEPVQRRHQIKEERSSLNEVLTRREHENNRDIARRESDNSETSHFNEKASERNEIRFENLRGERENYGNMDKSRQISLSDDDLLNRYDSRLNVRERSNRRSIQQLSEKTQESIQRRERRIIEHNNRLEEVRRSNGRLDFTDRLTVQPENLNKRESLDENHRSIERRQETLVHREVNRQEQSENQVFRRHHRRLSEQRETLRRLKEQYNEPSNKHLSNIEDENERQLELKNLDESRESRKSSQREDRNLQRRIAMNMERERYAERNVRDYENRRVTTRQLDNQEQRNDINNRLREREFTFTQRRGPEVFNGRREQQSVNAVLNRRQEHRFDNSPERRNVLNRNRDSQRSSERLIEFDVEKVENQEENYHGHVNRLRNSRRSEESNIHRFSNENQNSRRIDERRHENGLLKGNLFSRHSSFSKNELESVEQRDIGGSEFALHRKELRVLDERDNERNINSASEKTVELERPRERFSENIQERYNQNLDERKLRHVINRDIIESIQNNHQMVSRKGEATKLHQGRIENKRERREERESQRFGTSSNRNIENRPDFQLRVDEYEETPTDLLKNSNMAYVQGVLLAIVIMKTLNGKNNIKCQVSQKFQEAIAMIGF